MLSLSLSKAADAKTVLLSTSLRRRYCSVQGAQFCDVLEFFHFQNDVLFGGVIILPDLLQAALVASCGLTLGKKNFQFSIEYSIGFLLIVFYRIFANSFL